MLVAALALFILWCIGQAPVERKYHHRLQANTVRNKTVLSDIYLAMQIINDKRYQIEIKPLKIIIDSITDFTQEIDGLA